MGKLSDMLDSLLGLFFNLEELSNTLFEFRAKNTLWKFALLLLFRQGYFSKQNFKNLLKKLKIFIEISKCYKKKPVKPVLIIKIFCFKTLFYQFSETDFFFIATIVQYSLLILMSQKLSASKLLNTVIKFICSRSVLFPRHNPLLSLYQNCPPCPDSYFPIPFSRHFPSFFSVTHSQHSALFDSLTHTIFWYFLWFFGNF